MNNLSDARSKAVDLLFLSHYIWGRCMNMKSNINGLVYVTYFISISGWLISISILLIG